MHAEQKREIARRNAVSVVVVLVIAAAGWISRGWLEAQASSWPAVRFTLAMVLPAIAAAAWFSTHHQWVRNGITRFVTTLVVIGMLAWWYSLQVIPANYEWTQSCPVVAWLVVGLVAGVTLLAWAKPHLAGWPWWR